MSVVVAHDVIHANITHLPPGQSAGYTTGTPDIRWTSADFSAHPGAVRICQDSGSDHTADVLDAERGAATNGDAAPWYRNAEAAWHAARRPGQRSPAIYTSASNVTPLVNALIAGGVTSGVGLWVANWNLSDAQAYADVVNAAGPYPIIGVQWSSGQFYDTDVLSGGWLARVSHAPPVATGPPYRHLTHAGDTIEALAASRNATVEHFLARCAAAYTPADMITLRAAKLPAGIPWYSENP